MKAIHIAGVILSLAVSAWAAEPKAADRDDPATRNEPTVLSEAQMDDVTAGGFGDRRKAMLQDLAILTGGQSISDTSYTYDAVGN